MRLLETIASLAKSPDKQASPGGSSYPSALHRAVARFDSFARRVRLDAFYNEVTGLGTDVDKTVYTTVLPARRLLDLELSAVYHDNDIAQRAIDVIPDEIFREGTIVGTGDTGLDQKLADRLEELELTDRLADGWRWGSLYGGGACVLGADDGRNADEALVPDEADDLAYLYPIDRRQLWPYQYYEKWGHPRFGHPRTYMVTPYAPAMTGASAISIIHESRLVLFGGTKTGSLERAQYMGWDMSLLQRIFSVLRQFDSAWKSIEIMLTESNQSVLKMSGLAKLIGNENGEAALLTRLRVMDLYKSIMRSLVVDAESGEAYERQQVSFTDLPATLDKIMLRMAAAVPMPVSMLMGQSPAGMNATGESDFRWFENGIKSKQTRQASPKVRRIVDVMLRSKAWRANAQKRERITVTYPPLWKESPLEMASRRKAVIDGDVALITSQQVTPDKVALARLKAGGYDAEIVFDENERAAYEAALKADVEQIATGTPAGSDLEDPTGDTNELSNNDTIVGAPPTDEDARSLAAKMTEHAVPKCEHGYSNRCRMCGVERKRDFTRGEDGSTKWGVQWRAIGDRGQATNAMRFDGEAFELHRDEDETGVSGTGVVAEGMKFQDGTCVLRWLTEHRSTTVFGSIEDLEKIHGHGGKTRIVYRGAQT